MILLIKKLLILLCHNKVYELLEIVTDVMKCFLEKSSPRDSQGDKHQ